MIRLATRYDIKEIVKLVKEYAKESPCKLASIDENFDEQYISNLLFSLIVGRGFIVIDDEYKGFIAGIVTPNVWSPKLMELHELAWWVKPEYRNTSIGGRLWIEFNECAKHLIEEKRVEIIFVSSMVNSPKLDYEKRGYELLEHTYYKV